MGTKKKKEKGEGRYVKALWSSCLCMQLLGDSKTARKVAGKVREKATLLPRTPPCFMQEFLKDGKKKTRQNFVHSRPRLLTSEGK